MTAAPSSSLQGAPCRVLGLWLALLALSACDRPGPAFELQNITGLMPTLAFELRDQNDRGVSARDYRGETILLYFGYTHCPDACPTTLTILAKAVRALGPAASKVQVLFVTVDPERDTAQALKQYLSYFDSQFVGLRGDDAALIALTKRYRVAFHREPPDRYGAYAVDHGSAVFIFDRRGKPRLLAEAGDTAETIARDLRRLIASS